jgi:hypothetical protein
MSCHPLSTSRERRRKTTTRGTGCQFLVPAKESLDKSTRSLRHRPDKRFSLHNHAPSQHPLHTLHIVSFPRKMLYALKSFKFWRGSEGNKNIYPPEFWFPSDLARYLQWNCSYEKRYLRTTEHYPCTCQPARQRGLLESYAICTRWSSHSCFICLSGFLIISSSLPRCIVNRLRLQDKQVPYSTP